MIIRKRCIYFHFLLFFNILFHLSHFIRYIRPRIIAPENIPKPNPTKNIIQLVILIFLYDFNPLFFNILQLKFVSNMSYQKLNCIRRSEIGNVRCPNPNEAPDISNDDLLIYVFLDDLFVPVSDGLDV